MVRSSPVVTSDAIGVLIADSNRMQAQLLTSALRRHAEFHIVNCQMNTIAILQAVASKLPRIAVLSLNSSDISESVPTRSRFHSSHPEIPKLLLADSCHRELVVSAFRSGARAASFPSTKPTFACCASVCCAWPPARSGLTTNNSTM